MQRRELIVHVECPDDCAALVDGAENEAHVFNLATRAQYGTGWRMRVIEVHPEPSEHLPGFFQDAPKGER